MSKAKRALVAVTLVAMTCALLLGVLATTHPSTAQAMPAENQGKEKATPPVDQDYVGVKECAECHEKAFESWMKTGHAHAFKVLTEKYEKDPKCLKCHTTGYGAPTGFKDVKTTPNLKGITCETCHGQGLITDDPHCARCGDRPTAEQLDAVPYNGAMPCGHPIGYLIEEYPCAECDGQGAIETWIPLAGALQALGVSLQLQEA